MRFAIAVLTVVALNPFVSGAEQPPGADVSTPEGAKPIVGAIRWDAWYGRGSPVSEVEKTLGPKKYHFRLPFFAKVVSPAAVSIDGDSQQVMEQEITYAADAGLNYWAFVDYWDQGNLGIALGRYRAAENKKGIRFCLIEEGGRIDRIGTNGWPRLVACFKDPHYQTVLDGRPLLFVFGRPKVIGKNEFESLADQAVAAGLKKPYYVFMGWSPAADAAGGEGTGLRCSLRLRGGSGIPLGAVALRATDQARAYGVLGCLPPTADSHAHVCHCGLGSQASGRTSGAVDFRGSSS